MSRYAVVIASVAALTGLSLACTSSTPAAPASASNSSAANKAADGSTLKVTAPVPQSPTGNRQLTVSPVLTAGAASPTFGGNTALQYRFQVLNASGVAVVDSGLVDSLTYSVNANLPGSTPFTWRVRAEARGSAGPWSTAASFISAVPFDMRQAIIHDNPQDMGSWAETAKITSIDFTDNAMIVDFDKRTGPDRWPDVGFGDGSIEYTLGMCLNINQQWHCSAVVQFWFGRDLEASGRPDEVGINWFYDARWGIMNGHQPAFGETIGMFVAAGNNRDSGNVIVKERSNVVLMPFGGSYHP